MCINRFVLLGLVFASFGTQALAQSPVDERAIRSVVTRFEQAWNTHDMNILGAISTDDVDFVNVAGQHWKGRAEVVKQHADRHLVRFKNSVWTTKAAQVQFLRPDMALVHIDWETRGDLDFDLKPWPPRKGIFSWVMVKSGTDWRLRSAQNTYTTLPVLAAPKVAQ